MQKSKTTKQLSKYIFMGTLAFMIEYVSFLLLTYVFSIRLLIISQTISFCLGLLVSFLGSRQFTFKEENGIYRRSKTAQLASYATLALLNLLISNLLIHSLVLLVIPSWAAKVVTMSVIAVWNFVIFKKIIFKIA